MRKITYGLLWFQLLLMNIGLGMGTLGLFYIIKYSAPLIEQNVFHMILGLAYTLMYILLVIGVIGLDLKVYSKGIKCLYDALVKDAAN